MWNSESQTISTMLTVTDFVQMLNLCWYGTDNDSGAGGSRSESGQKPVLQMSDFDRITIHKWKGKFAWASTGVQCGHVEPVVASASLRAVDQKAEYSKPTINLSYAS